MFDIAILLKDSKKIIAIDEGCGDNLLREDIDEGFVDYANYYEYNTLEDFENEEYADGGMVMLTKNYDEYSAQEIAEMVMQFIDVGYDDIREIKYERSNYQ